MYCCLSGKDINQYKFARRNVDLLEVWKTDASQPTSACQDVKVLGVWNTRASHHLTDRIGHAFSTPNTAARVRRFVLPKTGGPDK